MTSLQKAIEESVRSVLSSSMTTVVEFVKENIDSFNDDEKDNEELVDLLLKELKLDAVDDKKERMTAKNVGEKLKGLTNKGKTTKATTATRKKGAECITIADFKKKQKLNKDVAYCSYVSPRGQNKDLVCGAEATAIGFDDTDDFIKHRCNVCKDKNGNGALRFAEDGGATKSINKKAVSGITSRGTAKKNNAKDKSKAKSNRDDSDDEDDSDADDSGNDDDSTSISLKAYSVNASLQKLFNDDKMFISKNDTIDGAIVHYDAESDPDQEENKIFAIYKGTKPLDPKVKFTAKFIKESFETIPKKNPIYASIGLNVSSLKDLLKLLSEDDDEEEVAPVKPSKKNEQPKKRMVEDDDDVEEPKKEEPKKKKDTKKQEIVDEEEPKKNSKKDDTEEEPKKNSKKDDTEEEPKKKKDSKKQEIVDDDEDAEPKKKNLKKQEISEDND